MASDGGRERKSSVWPSPSRFPLSSFLSPCDDCYLATFHRPLVSHHNHPSLIFFNPKRLTQGLFRLCDRIELPFSDEPHTHIHIHISPGAWKGHQNKFVRPSLICGIEICSRVHTSLLHAGCTGQPAGRSREWRVVIT